MSSDQIVSHDQIVRVERSDMYSFNARNHQFFFSKALVSELEVQIGKSEEIYPGQFDAYTKPKGELLDNSDEMRNGEVHYVRMVEMSVLLV